MMEDLQSSPTIIFQIKDKQMQHYSELYQKLGIFSRDCRKLVCL